jgi:hypothetical protein
MEDVVVVAAVALAAQATALAAKHVQDNENNKVKQRRTVTTLRFDAMLQSAVYSVWFETNLRCTRSTFFKLASFLRDQGIGFAHAMVKRHSYEKKLAAALYFFGSLGGYREVGGAMGMSQGYLMEIVTEVVRVLIKVSSRIIAFPSTMKK